MILIILIVRSLSSEVVLFNMHTELLKSKPISKYLVKSSTHYYPQLNKVAQGMSKSQPLLNNSIRSLERVYSEYKDLVHQTVKNYYLKETRTIRRKLHQLYLSC